MIHKLLKSTWKTYKTKMYCKKKKKNVQKDNYESKLDKKENHDE